ncbi:MAG: hypothetical protein ABSG68_01240 [Thermoguttaceae bacterium]
MILLLGTTAVALPLAPPGDKPLAKAAAWRPPRADEVQAQALAWLQQQKVAPATQAKAADVWAGLSDKADGGELLERLAATFALADAQAARLVELCGRPRTEFRLPAESWLADPKTPPLLAANLRLFYGRWLTQGAMFDEALEQLSGLRPDQVVAPAELLFYQGVVYHQLLDRQAAQKVLDQLLDGAEACPRRFVALARLMQADLGALEPDTLGHVARQMEDIRRRLDLGRAGPKVRKVEDGVIESLDKMIKKAEEQQQQAGSQSNQIQSSRPAPDSRLLGGHGAGEVTKRNIGNKSGWGDLPPKDREEALQQVGRDFPAEYRDIIEQYFRRLAAEENQENK